MTESMDSNKIFEVTDGGGLTCLLVYSKCILIELIPDSPFEILHIPRAYFQNIPHSIISVFYQTYVIESQYKKESATGQ